MRSEAICEFTEPSDSLFRIGYLTSLIESYLVPYWLAEAKVNPKFCFKGGNCESLQLLR